MPRFPEKEAKIVALADRMADGLLRNRSIYPYPPIHPLDLHIMRRAYLNRRDDLIAKQAAAEQATVTQNEVLEELIEAVKANIRYAENTVNYDDDKLKLIGWAGAKTITTLQPLGQPRSLEASKQGVGWVFLVWKAPAEGGEPKAYKVQCRNHTRADWGDVATVVLTKTTMVDQPQGKELEYRIIAVNKSGQGGPSNTVMTIL